MVVMMRIFSYLIFVLAISFSVVTHAEEAVVFSDVSSGIFRFQLKLAEQGNAEAQYIVGEMFETGSGVTKDRARAQSWFKKSAAQGHKKSVYKLLYLDIQNNGLNNSNKAQLGALRKQAATGSANAQYFLGKMYAAGVGVPKSLTNALTWLNKAKFHGLAEAEHEAIAVEEELARNQEKQAKKRAAALAESKQRKAAEARVRSLKQKQADKKRRAEYAKRQSSKDTEAKRLAAQHKRKDEERRLLAEEKLRLEKEKQAIEADIARNEKKAKKTKQAKKTESESSYISDPCKGKSARFLSTCR